MADAATVETVVEETTPAAESTALQQLAEKGDFAGFTARREADLRGEKLAVAEKPAETAAEGEPPAAVEGEKPESEQTEDEKAEAKAASDAGKALAEVKSRAERRKQSIQKDIDDLRRAKGEEERELARIRSERAALEAKQAEKPAETKPAATAKPKPRVTDPEWADKPYEDFVEGLAEWIAENKTSATRKDLETELAAERERIADSARARAQQEVYAQHTARINAFRATHADYDAVAAAIPPDLEVPQLILDAIPYSLVGPDVMYHFARNPKVADALMDLPMTEPMRDGIMDSEIAPALLSHLVEHPEDAKRIATLDPRRQLREIGKLEARLTSPKPGPTSPAAPVTKAERPIKPVGPSATATTVSLETLAAEGRTADFMRMRDEEELARRRARR